VEGGIEARHLGRVRQSFADRLDAGQRCRQVQGGKRYQCVQPCHQFGGDALGPGMFATVHHAVTDGVHARVIQVAQQTVQRGAMVRQSVLFAVPTALDTACRCADFPDCATPQTGFGIVVPDPVQGQFER
jgi:hypothetical protein